VTASRQGGPSLNVLAGLTAGNFSGYWMGIAIVSLMGIAYGVSTTDGLAQLITFGSHGEISGFAATAAAAVFAFGLVAFGFLGMGPVTIAVDSYGPVTDNAQSVYELSVIESLPGISDEIKKDFGFTPDFDQGQALPRGERRRRQHLQGDRQAGADRHRGGRRGDDDLRDHHAPDRRPEAGPGHRQAVDAAPAVPARPDHRRRVIYWFTGASTQAVSTGAYRAVEFIKANIKLDGGAEKASIEDSKKVVEICTKYAQKGMINIFLVLFFSTLAFACLEPYFFIGYLISMALFGLYQAIFMANAGGAWDNAKKIVEVELKEKGTDLHAASVVGDTVGDPFKDTSSVALNPVIKFTTLFGVLAVGLSLKLSGTTNHIIAAVGFAVSAFFVYRSFYGMRIDESK
jgi:K(+)-stimulated pyrophosphate-energized sodium pump